MPDHIPSEDLTLDRIPDPDTCTEGEAWEFFHTFHAYTYWGGLEEAFKSSDVAAEWQAKWLAEQDPEPEFYRYPEPLLDNLRTAVFLDCRAARHCEATGSLGLKESLRAVRYWVRLATPSGA
mgnify:CR=1 FL=1